MGNNILKEKSYAFAIKIVKTSERLIAERKEFVLAKQLLKSGTAVGALIREAEFAQSKADFINKMSIALKEANETIYWLSLLKDVGYLNNESSEILSADCKEIISLLVASVKTAKANL